MGRVLILVLILQLVCPWAAYAQEAPVEAPSLDLSSTERNVAASSILSDTGQAVITLGAATRSISPTDMLTAAEMVAVRQVINTGTQYLHLNDVGAAIGGGLQIQYHAADGLANLVIPEGVRVSQNAAMLQNLNLSGNFNNSGIYNLFSNNSAITSATISAANIYNNAGASIASTLATLNLNAVNNIVNAGTISSAGVLNMTAGGSITNLGVMQAMSNFTAQAASMVNTGTMLAQMGNVNAVTANLTNSGIMQALAGKLTVSNTISNHLMVDSLNGVMSAARELSFLNSATTFNSDGSLNSKGLLNVTGGTLTGSSVNFDSPGGIVGVAAEQINGPVNVSGAWAAVGADHGLLQVNSFQITGDPIFSTTGDLELNLGGILQTSIAGGPYGGIDFIALAGGNITASDSQANSLSSAMGTASSGKIVLASGVTFTVNTPNCTTCVEGVAYTINGTSTGGGNIQLANNAFMTGDANIEVIANGGTTNDGTVAINGLSAYGVNSNVSITADSTVQLGSSASYAGNEFSITAGGAITPIGTITAKSVALVSTSDSVNLRQDITATTEITVTAGGDGIFRTNGTLSAPSIALDSQGDIGSATEKVVVDTTILGANANGDVYVASVNPGITQLAASSAGSSNTFSMTSIGNLFPGLITADDVILQTTGINSRIMSTGNITAGSTISYLTNNFVNGASQSAGTSITVTGTNLFVTDVGSVFGGGTLTAPSINFVSSGSLSVNQEQLIGTVDTTSTENLILHVDNSSGFTLGTMTTGYTVNSAPFGGTTYYAANNATVFNSGAVIALTDGSVAPTINATLNGSQELINTLDVTGQSTGNMLVFVAAPNLATTSVSNSNNGVILVDNPYSGMTIETLSGNTLVIVGAGGTIETTGTSTIEANSMVLRTNGNNPDIIIGNGFTVNSDVTLDSLVNIEQSGGVLTANVLNLQSYVGHIGTSSDNIVTDAAFVTALAQFGTDVYVTGGSGIQFGRSAAGTSSGNTLQLSSGQALNITGELSGDTVVLLGGANGQITIGADIVAGQSITVTASGSGGISAEGSLTAPSISLNSDTGNIGSAVNPITLASAQSVQALQLELGASSDSGDVYVSNQSNMLLHLSASDVGTGILNLTSTSNIEVVGDIQGEDIYITATGDVAGIALSANITATGSVTLALDGGGSLTQTDDSFSVSAVTVNLLANIGNIGYMNDAGGAIQRINVDANILTASNQAFVGGGFQGTPTNQGGARAIVFVHSMGDVELNGFNGSAAQEFSLLSDGAVTLASGAVAEGVFYFSQGPTNPSIVITAPAIYVASGARIQSSSQGQSGAIQLNTNALENDGIIAADSIYIKSFNNGADNLTITGDGTIANSIFPGFVDQGYIEIQSSGAVSIHQGEIHGYVANAPGFQGSSNYGIPSYTASSFSLTVESGVVHLGRIASSGATTFVNNNGDIKIGDNNDQVAAITGSVITLTVNGADGGIRNGTISLGTGSSINASNTLTFNTPVLNNNSGSSIYSPSGSGSFSGNTNYILNTTLTLDITNEHGSSQYNGTYVFLWGLPAVHANNSITVQNPDGDLLVGGVGGMWTGTTTGAAVKSGDYSGIGTGDITFSAPNGSVIASQTVLMGNIYLNAKTSQDSNGNAGLAMLDLGVPGLYTFSNYNLTAFNNNTSGFAPISNQVIPNACHCSPYGDWHPNTSTPAVTSMNITAAGTESSLNFTFGTITGTTYYKAPAALNVNGMLILSSLFNGGPTIVVPSYTAGDYVLNGNFSIGTQGPANGQGQHSHPFNTLVVHTSLPFQMNGNLSISSNGNVYVDTGSFGAFNIGTTTSGYDLTVEASGNLAFNGTGAVLYLTNGTPSGFVHEIYAPNGRVNIDLDTSSAGNFFNNGSQITGGRIDATITGTGAGRAVLGIMKTFESNSQNGDITISDTANPGAGSHDIQIGFIDAYRSVSILNQNGDMFMDANTVQANDGNDSVTGSISLIASNGSMDITYISNILPAGLSGEEAPLTIQYNGDFSATYGVNLGHSAGTTTISDLSSSPTSGHQFFLYKANVGGTHANITTSDEAWYAVNGNVGVSNDGNINITHYGNLLIEGGIGSNGGSVTITNVGNLTIGGDIGTNIGSNGGMLTIGNTGGSLLITNDSLLNGTVGVAISNSGGTLTLNDGASVQSEANLSLTNSGGALTIETQGVNASGGPNFSMSPNFGLGQQGGSLEASGSITVSNDQNIVVTGPGADSLWAPDGITFLSSNGTVSVSQFQLSSVVSGQSYSTFSVTATGSGLNVGTILANLSGAALGGGDVTLIAGTGTLQVLNNGQIRATGGDLWMQNTTGGFIALGTNAFLSSTDSGQNGVITIVSGTLDNPAGGVTPANVVDDTANGGQIIWGLQGATAQAPTNYVSTSGGNVTITSVDSAAITFGGNVIINSTTAGDLPPDLITSLDLVNDSNAINLLLQLQTDGYITGNLQLVMGDLVGEATLLPSNFALTLTALNIPDTVTLTMQDFLVTNPLNVSITGSSTTTSAIIAGTQEFVSTGPPSYAVLNIQTTESAPALILQNGGLLTSDGTLNLVSNGNITTTGGLIQTTNLAVTATGNVTVISDGDVTLINSNVGGTYWVSTINDGNIYVGPEAIVYAGGDMNLTATGTGGIFAPYDSLNSLYGGYVQAGNTVNLVADTGNIGVDDWNEPVWFQGPNVTVNTDGSAWINNCWLCPDTPTYLGSTQVGGSLHVIVCCNGDLEIAAGATVAVNTLNNSTDFYTFYAETNFGQFIVGQGANVQIHGNVDPANVLVETFGAPMVVEAGGRFQITGDGDMTLNLVPFNGYENDGLLNYGFIGTETGTTFIVNEYGYSGFAIGGNGYFTGNVDANMNGGSYQSIHIHTISGSITTAEEINTIDTFNNSNGGNVTLIATGDITVGGDASISTLASDTEGNAGNVVLSSSAGTINVTSITATGGTDGGNGGNVSIYSGIDYTIGHINVEADVSSGNSGTGGNVTITSDGSLTTGHIYAGSSTAAGNSGTSGAITLTAATTIDTEELVTNSETGDGTSGLAGAITLSAAGAITTTSLSAYSQGTVGSGTGGNISVITDSAITVTSIDTYSDASNGVSGNAGSVIMIGDSISKDEIRAYSQGDDGSGNGGSVTLVAKTSIGVGLTSIQTFSEAETSGNSGNAGFVTLAAGTSITNFNIGAYSYTPAGNSGSGGDVTISAGTTVDVFAISGYSWTEDGNSGTTGNVTITAGQTIEAASVQVWSEADATGTSAGTGNITLIAGGAITPGALDTSVINSGTGAGNAGSITVISGAGIDTGNFNSYSSSTGGGDSGNGGNIVLVALAGDITVSSSMYTFTDGPTTVAGSVSMVASGKISVSSQLVTSTSGANSYSGNIFVSSGDTSGNASINIGTITATSGAGGTDGNIFLGANTTGTNGQAGSDTSASGPIQYSTGGILPYLFYDGTNNPGTVTSIAGPGPTTLTVDTTSITILPGVYTSTIGSSQPVNLMLNVNGDSRTIVPIVSSSNVNLAGLNANIPANQGSGYTMVVVSGGSTGIALSGDVNDAVPAQATYMAALGSGDITQSSSNVINGDSLSIFATGGDIGTNTDYIHFEADTLTSGTVGFGKAFLLHDGTGSLNVASITSGVQSGGPVHSGRFHVFSNGALNVTGPVAGQAIALITMAGNSNVTINQDIVGTQLVVLQTHGSGDVMQTGGRIVAMAEQIQLNSTTGDIGTSLAPIQTAGSAVVSGNTGGTGNVNISHLGPTTLLGSQAGGDFTLTVSGGGDVTISAITTLDGDITVTTSYSNNTLLLTDTGELTANGGSITLQNNNQDLGKIVIGNGASLSTVSGGDINIVIGPVPSSPEAGVEPDNVSVNEASGGAVYFGTYGITANSPTNEINANGSSVVFSSGALNVLAITLDGDTTINASDTEPFSGLTSLDLTDPTTVALIIQLQGESVIGGTLIESGGIATGGNVILGPSDLTAVLTAYNIPENVTVTMQDFTASDLVNIDITSSSTSSQAILSGTHDFTWTSGTDTGVMQIYSDQIGPVLLINTTGLLSSEGGLTITVNGSIQLAGSINAVAAVSMDIPANGNIASSGGTITGSSISMTVNGGFIGTLLNPISTNTENLTLSTFGTGQASIVNSMSLTLTMNSSVPDLRVVTFGTLDTTDAISVDNSLLLETNDVLTLNGNIDGQVITLKGAPVLLNGYSLDASYSVTLTPTQVMEVNVGGATASGNTFDITAGDLANITSGFLTIGDTTNTSSFDLQGDVDITSNNIGWDLKFLSLGDYNSNGNSIILDAQLLTITSMGDVSTDTITGSFSWVTIYAAGALTLNGGIDVSGGVGNGGLISLSGSPIIFNDQILNAGDPANDYGIVILNPSTPMDVTVGGASGGASFDVSADQLALITTDTLQIGDIMNTKSLTISADIDVSGGVGSVGQYNLVFVSAGTFTNTHTINIGAESIGISTDGGLTNLATGNLDVSYLFAYGPTWRTTSIGDFVLKAGGSISLDYSNYFPTTVDMTYSAGQITLVAGGANTYNPSGSVITFTGGGGTTGGDINWSGTLRSNGDITVTATGGSVYDGSAGLASVNTFGMGNVTITADADISLEFVPSRVAQTITLNAGGNIRAARISANSINIESNGGDILSNGFIFADDSISMSTNGSGAITFDGFSVQAPTIEITAEDGAVTIDDDASLVAPTTLSTNASITITANAIENNGLILNGDHQGQITLEAHDADLQLTGQGHINADPTTGSIELTSTTGSVSATQEGFLGTVTGSADNAFLVKFYDLSANDSSPLVVGDIAAGGDITIDLEKNDVNFRNVGNTPIIVASSSEITSSAGSVTFTTNSEGAVIIHDSNIVISGATDVTFNTSYLENNGNISAGQELLVQNGSANVIVGTGNLNATTITFEGNSVVAMQNKMEAANLNGEASTMWFTSVADSTGFNQGTITLSSGSITEVSSGAGTVLYAAPHAQVFDSNTLFVLSDGDNAPTVINNSGALSITGVTDSLVVAVLNDVNVSSIDGIQTDTGSIFVGSTNAGGLTFNDDIEATSTFFNIDLYSAGNMSTQNITTTSGALSDMSRSIRLTAAGDIFVDGNIVTSSTSQKGGSVLLDAGGNISIDNVITTAGDDHKGGNVYMNALGSIDITGFIDSSAETVSGADSSADAGWVYLTAATSIDSTGSIRANGGEMAGSGNTVVLSAASGDISIDAFIDTAAIGTAASTGGDVVLHAAGDINIVSVNTIGSSSAVDGNKGGNIILQSDSGTFSVNNGFIDSSAAVYTASSNGAGSAGLIFVAADAGIAGDPSFRAEGRSSTGNDGYGNNIRIETNGIAELGFVSSSAQSVIAATGAGTAGRIDVIANGGLVGTTFRANGGVNQGNGGDITLSSTNGDISTGFVYTSALGTSGNGGDITIRAVGVTSDVTITGFIDTNGATTFDHQGDGGSAGNVYIYGAAGVNDSSYIIAIGGESGGNGGNVSLVTAEAGAEINASQGIDTHSRTNGIAGSILLVSDSDITTGDLLAFAHGNFGHGGNVTITSANGEVSIDDFISTSSSAIIGSGGNINVTAAAISGNTSIDIDTSTLSGNAGDITLTADNSITVNQVYALGGTYSGDAGSIEITSTDGMVTFDLIHASSGEFGHAGTVTLNASTGITGDQSVSGSTVSMITEGGVLTAPDSITANEGNIILGNSNTTNGSIVIGTNSTLTAVSTDSSSLGHVYIFIGAFPPSEVNTAAPANVSVNDSNGGVAYFGANSIDASSPTNTLNVDGSKIVFSTSSLSASAITLGGNVTINATAPNNTEGPIYSLDFTDPDLTSLIISLQGSSQVGGTLQVDGEGVATGGNAIIGSSMLANELTGVNIPTGVTITFEDFTAGNPLAVAINSESYTNVATISGTAQFTTSGSPSGGVINVVSDQASQGRSAFVLTGTGQLISDGSLSLSASGNMIIAGTISADTTLTLQTTANNGNIAITGDVSATNSATVSVNGSGTVSGEIDAPNFSFNSSMGNLGTVGTRFVTSANALSVATGGDAYITNSSDATLNVTAGSARNYHVYNNKAVTVSGTINAQQSFAVLTTDNDGSITFDSNINAPNWTYFMADGDGDIVQNSGFLRTSSASFLTGTGNIGSDSKPINTNAFYLEFVTTGGDVDIVSSNSVRIFRPSSGASVDVTANGEISVNSAIVATGSVTFHGAGSIHLFSNVTAPSFVSLYGNGHGNILTNGGSIITPVITTSTGSGNVGSDSTALETTATTVSSTNQGSNNTNITGNGSQTTDITGITSGNLQVTSNGNVTASGDITGSQGVVITTGGDLTVGNVTTTNGSIELTGNGTVTVTDGSTVHANEGDITIHNDDESGTITLEQNSTVEAYTGDSGSGLGNVTITVGTSAGTGGSTGSNVNENIQGGGQIVVGTNGFNADSPTNNLNAIGATITIDAGSSGTINLGGGVTITADPPITVGSTGAATLSPVVAVARAEVVAPAEIANVLPLLNVSSYNSTTTNVNTTRLVRAQVSTDSTMFASPLVMQLAPNLTPAMQLPSTGSMLNNINNVNSGSLIQPGVLNTPSANTQSPPTQSQADDAAEPTAYLPIAYTATSAPTSEAIVNTTNELTHTNFASCSVRHTNADISYSQEGYVTLNSGEILVHSPERSTIKTGDYTISVDPGSVALITREGSVVKVRALHESHTNAIVVTAGNNPIKVSVGQEVMVAPHAAHLQVAAQKDGLGRRHVVDAELPNGHAMSRSEFSHMCLMEQSNVMTKLVQSKSPADKQLSDKLIKTAACLMTVTGAHGAYSGK